MQVDASRLRGLSEDFAGRAARLEQEIFGLAGREFSVGSPKQLAQVRAVRGGAVRVSIWGAASCCFIRVSTWGGPRAGVSPCPP